MFESLRISVMDAAAPALDVLSRPLAALATSRDRAREFLTVYQDNRRLAAENERLLSWQQAALKLASENAQLRELAEADSRTRGLLCHGPRDREFRRRLCPQPDG